MPLLHKSPVSIATPLEDAWLAGLFEGEGCIALRRSGIYSQWATRLAMIDKDVVEKAWKIAGVGHFSGPYKPTSRPEHYLPQWDWRVSQRDEVLHILERIVPFLGERRSLRANEAIVDLRTRISTCFRGHSEAEMHTRPDGRRYCNTCQNERRRERRLRNKVA